VASQKVGRRRRKSFTLEGETIWVAPPEYVIIRKLEYYREGKSDKHLQDIRNILNVSLDQLDFQFLKEKIVDYALEKEWEKVSNWQY
jgi:hypothetical protein